MRDLLLFGAAAITLTIVVTIILTLIKRGSIYRIYKKAVYLENRQVFKEAIELYELILEETGQKTVEDRNFLAVVSRRLKRLRAC